MIKRENSGLRFYQFESLKNEGFLQAVFTRLGGSSLEPWKSLNLGGTVGDLADSVAKNLSNILDAIGGVSENLVQIKQIHSNRVVLADRPMDWVREGDAMITNKPGLILFMRFADCVPILFFDPVLKTAGIAHAGWRGTVAEIALETVRKMNQAFGSKPSDILAGIGPSIGPDHYIVGEDVISSVREVYPGTWKEILLESSGGVKMDLWKANQLTLLKAGVKSIEISEMCTGCHTDEWFSHRAENGLTGRFAALVGLQ